MSQIDLVFQIRRASHASHISHVGHRDRKVEQEVQNVLEEQTKREAPFTRAIRTRRRRRRQPLLRLKQLGRYFVVHKGKQTDRYDRAH